MRRAEGVTERMGLDKPQSLALRELIDADALSRDLTAMAKTVGGDPGGLRKQGLALIKQAFLEARENVK